MKRLSLILTFVAFLLLLTKHSPLNAESKVAVQSIEAFTEKMNRHEGYFDFYWDKKKGKVYLEIANVDEEFLYVHGLATGLGSNPVGLDRGQLGGQKVVRFTRVGPKVLMVQRNLRFRAITENELEKRAVEESFAQSVIWGGEVAAETDERLLVDVTSLLMSDAHGVTGTLKSSDQGDFSLDLKRSAVFLDRCKAFPDNTELEATLTFKSKNPGRYVRQTTPTAQSLTLRQHHSFVKLPNGDYQPRKYDVRSPCISITFADYASPLDKPLEYRWITRHRLIKKDPTAEISEPVEPIVYYVDAGAPKQIQEALVEGASWWNQAFESAGFKNAFEVKLLPADADPMDVRYNVIQWVHRSTRGWSYGGSVIDPRTGEIIKGHVSLGSLRVRQDQLLVHSLGNDSGRAPANVRCSCCGIGGVEAISLAGMSGVAESANPLEVSLARIRQLSAHEVGHTIGFVHNFAASTYGDRASVMDYPAPRIKIDDQGQLDFSDAYAVGIGEWDKVSVKYAYTQFADAVAETKGLDEILRDAADREMIFLSDSDARPAGAAHPLANLWDNGTDPLEELAHLMKVRRIALEKFSPTQLPAETTTADIAQYLTPLYLHHRFQLQAVGKLIGGNLYAYGYADKNSTPNEPVSTAVQIAAVEALIETIHPKELMLDVELLKSISPRPYSSIRDSEILPKQTGRIFDPLAAARVATDLTLNELLQHQRLARFARQSNGNPDIAPVNLIRRLVGKTWIEKTEAEHAQVARVVRESVVEHLLALVDNRSADVEVRAAALAGLQMVVNLPGEDGDRDVEFNYLMKERIKRFLERPYTELPTPKSLDTPPGSPIGSKR